MPFLTRRLAFGLIAAATAVLPALPASAQTKLKWAHVYEASEPYHKWALWAGEELKKRKLHCVLVDEAQFLTRHHVLQLCRVADELSIPVLCYGLRTDFQGNLFEGSAALLALADALVELKAVCECGRKATMNLRVDAEGHAVASGAQTEIGGNDRYVALCRRHFFERLKEGEARQLSLTIPR